VERGTMPLAAGVEPRCRRSIHGSVNARDAPFRLVVKSLMAAALLVLLILALVRLLDLVLLVFGAVVIGILIRALADAIGRYTFIAGRWRLYAALVVIVAVVGVVAWVFGSQLSGDFSRLARTLVASWRELERRIAQFPGGAAFVSSFRGVALSARDMVPHLLSMVNSLTNAAIDLVLLLFGSIFFAANPSLYRAGLVQMVPKRHRPLADEALRDTGAALRQWMVGQFAMMVFIGVLTGTGLWLVGVPSAAALGVIAGFLEAIPYFGPILSAFPALAMAATKDMRTVLLALAVVTAVQQLEAALFTPYVHKKVVSLPPAVSVFGVVAMGVLFGPLGLLFAAPLLVTVFVLVKRLYVEEALDTPTPVPGRDDAEEPPP
jgi:predicted PurR-regulated permease PerM